MEAYLPSANVNSRKPSYRHRILFFLLFFVFSSYAAAVEEVKNFFSSIKVNKDASLDIEEKITIQAEGHEFKHGLLRFFNKEWTATIYGKEYNHHTDYKINAALLDGSPVLWSVKKYGSPPKIKIYIGDPDSQLPPGEHIYTLRYHVDSAVHFYAWGNRLIWNITGQSWTVPIAFVEGVVTLPDTAKIINLRGFPDSSKYPGSDVLVQKIKSNQAEIQSRQINNLAVQIDWEGGFLTRPPWTIKAERNEKIAGIITIDISAAMIILMMVSLLKFIIANKPPKDKPIPDHSFTFSPAEMGYIIDREYSDGLFSLTIIDMIARGILTVDGQNKNEKSIILKRGNHLSADLFEEQKQIIDTLFAESDSFEFKIENKKTIKKAMKALECSLEQDVQKKYYSLFSDFSNSLQIFLPFSLFFLWFYADLSWIMLLFSPFGLIIPNYINWQGRLRRVGFWHFKTIGLLSLFIGFTLFFALLTAIIPANNPTVGLVFSLTYILMIGLNQLSKSTPLGCTATEHIYQLKEKIQSLHPQDITVEKYRSLLSYAMLFDLNEKFDHALANIKPLPVDLNEIMTCISNSKSHTRAQPSYYIYSAIFNSTNSGGGAAGGRGGGGGGGGW